MIARNKYILFILLVMGLLHSQKTFPIGRIGNNESIGDPIEGFNAEIPIGFPNVFSIAADRSAKLISNEVLTPQSLDAFSPESDGSTLMILAFPFSSALPSLVGKTGQQIVAYLQTAYQFKVIQLEGPQCTTLLLGENSVGYIGVAIWRNSTHGYVLNAQRTPSEIGKNGIMRVLTTTQVAKPCQQ